MKQLTYILAFLIALTFLSAYGQTSKKDPEIILKIEMNLSAFGVESDNFPSIRAIIDFTKDTSFCVKSYYNPALKGSTYSLTKKEMKEIFDLLKISDVKNLKPQYKVSKTDQANSTTTIYTNKSKYVIEDYGLDGDYPLQKLYKAVYKL